jgi:hypothetical protein
MTLNPYAMKGKHYQLIQFSQPIIADNRRMISDNNKGGIILVYMVRDIKYVTIFKKRIILSTSSFRKITFFRPLKKAWSKSIYRITPKYWGKKGHLLTNMWLYVDNDFKDMSSIAKADLKKVLQCRDAKLIKQLNVRKETFIL